MSTSIASGIMVECSGIQFYYVITTSFNAVLLGRMKGTIAVLASASIQSTKQSSLHVHHHQSPDASFIDIMQYNHALPRLHFTLESSAPSQPALHTQSVLTTSLLVIGQRS